MHRDTIVQSFFAAVASVLLTVAVVQQTVTVPGLARVAPATIA